MHRKEHSIRNRMKRLGIKSPKNVNENFFLRDDEEKHYILGYWLADGCIMYKSGGYYFSIVSNDLEHLRDIATIMEVKTKLYKNSNDAYEIRVGNKRLVKSLMDIGGTYRKTETMHIDKIHFNKKHFRHLLRGFFDGDGSVSHQRYTKKDGSNSVSGIKFSGAKTMITSLYEFMGSKGTLYPDYRKDNCYYLEYHGDEMRNILKYMYKDSSIKLKRKEKAYNMGFQ